MSQEIRYWIDLLNESENNSDFFTDSELDILEQYGYPIYGFVEAIQDFETPIEERNIIKDFLQTLISDGGLWGETLNAHDVRTTRLKQKVINLINSI
jgi:hypothetical protein